MIKSIRSNKGQASLEYLLVTAGFLGMLLFLAPYFVYLSDLALYTEEVGKAQYFIEQANHEVTLLSLLGRGSQKTIDLHPEMDWQIDFFDKTVRVTLNSPSLNQVKVLERNVPIPFATQSIQLTSSAQLLFRKDKGKVSVIYR